MAETTRLTLDLKLPVRERLDQLKAKTNADSLVEVIRRALAVYDYVMNAKGKLILREDDGTEREVILL